MQCHCYGNPTMCQDRLGTSKQRRKVLDDVRPVGLSFVRSFAPSRSLHQRTSPSAPAEAKYPPMRIATLFLSAFPMFVPSLSW